MKFTRADLTQVTFNSETVLANTDFSHANMTRAVFDGARMRGVRLDRANLEDATMKNGVMEDTDLSHAECKGFRVTGTIQTRVKWAGAKNYDAGPSV